MNTGTVILGAIFIAICAMPFIFMARNNSKKRRKFLKLITNMANKHHAIISQFDVGSDFIIGLDDVKNLVFFAKNQEDKSVEDMVDLALIKDCKTIKISKTNNKKNSSHAIENLKLGFFPVDGNQSTHELEFFNEDTNMQLSGELELINNWEFLIQQKLKTL